MHLGATYWSSSGLPNSPSYSNLAQYTQANATGIHYQDNWPAYDISLDDFHTGVEFSGKNKSGIVTGEMVVNLEVSGANTGLLIDGDNFYVTGGSISATAGTNPTAVSIIPTAVNAVNLNEVSLASNGYDINNQSPTYTVNLMHSTLSSWGANYAIASAGELLLEGSNFLQKANASSKDLSLGANVPDAIVMSNTYPAGQSGLSYDSQANPSDVSVNDSPLSLPGVTGFAYSGAASALAQIPAQPKPANTTALYDVTGYGAVADCNAGDFDSNGKLTGSCTDNTAAFQAVLNAAGKTGGTVYVPGSLAGNGYFFTGHLAVPSGVELTGAPQDTAFHTIDTGTALFVQGDSNPFMTLGASAGVRGLAFWYTNQNGYTQSQFGYTIQAQGQNDWVVNTVLANATNGLDFGSYNTTGHYISGLQATSIGNPLYVSKSSRGFIGNFQTVGTFWDDINKNARNQSHISYPTPTGNPPGNNCGVDNDADTDVSCAADAYVSGEALKLGSATNELIVNAYLHGPHEGILTVPDNGAGPNFTLIQYGSETFTGLDLEALNPAGAKIISAQYHTISEKYYPGGCPGQCPSVPSDPYLVVGNGVPATAPISFFTYANHDDASVGLNLSGGNTVIQDYYSDQDGDKANTLQASAHVQGLLTGFAIIGGKYLNPFDAPANIITDDISPNVGLAGTSLASALSISGPVNLLFQPGGNGAFSLVTPPPTGGATSTPTTNGQGNTGGSGTGPSCPSFTRNLTLGASGADVTALQNLLIQLGYSVPSGATGYFGAQTQAAVQAFQGAQGIVSSGTPTTTGFGNAGARTRDRLTLLCATASKGNAGGGTTTGTGGTTVGGTTGTQGNGTQGSGTTGVGTTGGTSPATTTNSGPANGNPVITVNPLPTAPSVSAAASPATIQAGQSTTVSWNSNATTCQINNAANGVALASNLAASGSMSFTPSSTSTYQVYCTRTVGNMSSSGFQNVTVTVTSVSNPLSASINTSSLTANSTTATVTGSASGTALLDVLVYPASNSDVTTYQNSSVSVANGTWSAQVTGLASGSYTVEVHTASGTASAQNLLATGTLTVNTSSAGTDTTPPTAPTLTASVSAPGVSLSWGGATDNAGAIKTYRVFRDGTALVITSATSYLDTTATSGSHAYTVKAVDAAGNVSGPSNKVTVTTNVSSSVSTTASSNIVANAWQGFLNILTGN